MSEPAAPGTLSPQSPRSRFPKTTSPDPEVGGHVYPDPEARRCVYSFDSALHCQQFKSACSPCTNPISAPRPPSFGPLGTGRGCSFGIGASVVASCTPGRRSPVPSGTGRSQREGGFQLIVGPGERQRPTASSAQRRGRVSARHAHSSGLPKFEPGGLLLCVWKNPIAASFSAAP
jgi:hypothetical protein